MPLPETKELELQRDEDRPKLISSLYLCAISADYLLQKVIHLYLAERVHQGH